MAGASTKCTRVFVVLAVERREADHWVSMCILIPGPPALGRVSTQDYNQLNIRRKKKLLR